MVGHAGYPLPIFWCKVFKADTLGLDLARTPVAKPCISKEIRHHGRQSLPNTWFMVSQQEGPDLDRGLRSSVASILIIAIAAGFHATRKLFVLYEMSGFGA
jgi:hypothetical protein